MPNNAKQKPLTSYTKTTLLPGEKMVYAGVKHPFSRYFGIFMIAIGTLLISPDIIGSFMGDINTENAPFKETRSQISSVIDNIVSNMPLWAQDTVSEVNNARMKFVGILCLVIGFFKILMSYIRKYSVEQVVTTRKIIYKWGLIKVDEIEIPLHQIESVKVKQTALDRMIGRGNILVTGVGMEHLEIEKIRDPGTFRQYAYHTIEQQRTGGNQPNTGLQTPPLTQ